LLAVLFFISGGAAFSQYFKGRKVLSFLATIIALIATFYFKTYLMTSSYQVHQVNR
jgi:hypothetical protein